jgi:farnesyl-diphosphate farnesyltransferase
MGALSDSLLHPTELLALVQYKVGSPGNPVFTTDQDPKGTLRRSYEFLRQTSRSFAAVIQELHPDLREAVCIFYLVLRGLDTVEDDMTLPLERKLAVMGDFHNIIHERGWTFTESGPNEADRALLVDFHVVIDQFLTLSPAFQTIITDITQKMSAGMAEFCQRRVVTQEDYNLYCHYVAGLVGIGLSGLFAASGLEGARIAREESLSNSMGLFLQKTNIIRDYLEDQVDGRSFWPREIYSLYAPDLADLRKPENKAKALHCLNHMCLDALSHAQDSLEYLSNIREPSVFRFCAIPQVMAIATLAEVFNNYAVFQGVVKIRKGTAVSLIQRASDLHAVRLIFAEYLQVIAEANLATDPNFTKISLAIGSVRAALGRKAITEAAQRSGDGFGLVVFGALSIVAAYVAVNGSHFATTWATQ